MRAMTSYEPRTRRFTRAEYEKLIELGVFQPGEAIELIGGELMVAEPQGAAHYTAILKIAKALEGAFGPGWVVRTQGPIGLDEDAPIELLDGLLLVKEPQHSRHRTAVLLVAKAVERAFAEGWFVQTQSPIILGDRSEPEPDVCLIRGSPRDYVNAHPTRPALIVEVAQSGLALARGRKAAAYARAGIADYWILNLDDRVLEVHREPARPGPARRNWGHAAIETLGADTAVTPLAAPAATTRVADLLP